MAALGYLIAGVFLPLFPFGMLFNQLFARMSNARLRMGLLLLWPQLGGLALVSGGERPPAWMLWWAVATAALYGLRSVALRDLGLWTGYMATSAWALLRPAAAFGVAAGGGGFALQAVGLSLPSVLLAWLVGRVVFWICRFYALLCLRDCLATRPINRIVNQAPLCTAFDYYRSAEEVSDKRRDILVPCSRMVYVRNLYSIDVIESAMQTFSLLPSGGAKHGNLGCLFLF
jgi:hypothetical protein